MACAVVAACGSQDAAGTPPLSASTIVKVRALGDNVWRFADGQALAWSPDDSRIAIGGWSRIVSVIDPATGAHAWDSDLGFDEVIDAVAWSPDGKHVAAGTRRDSIVILAAATGAVETKITTTMRPAALTYTARGDQIVAATGDKVRVFDVAGGSAADFAGECSDVELGAASRDRSVLVVGGERGAVCVYSIAKRARIAEYPNAHHYNPVASVSVSADGTSYATAGHDQWLQVWLGGKLATDTPQWPKETHAIALVDGGNVVTAIDHTIAIAPAATPRIATKALAEVVNARMVVPSNDGKRLAIRTDGALQIVGIDGKSLAGPGAGHTAWLVAVGELPDGHIASIARDDRLIVWDGTTPKRTLGAPGDKVWAAAIAARAPIAVTSSGIGPTRVYDLAAGKLVT
ncbi:MAG TPA: WD40 repeat domain-containing protein, partial [Kofleriaceae bacterium]|nr:WD40 repeat domain-containing protein [Kofleriaceae bacterium]